MSACRATTGIAVVDIVGFAIFEHDAYEKTEPPFFCVLSARELGLDIVGSPNRHLFSYFRIFGNASCDCIDYAGPCFPACGAYTAI